MEWTASLSSLMQVQLESSGTMPSLLLLLPQAQPACPPACSFISGTMASIHKAREPAAGSPQQLMDGWDSWRQACQQAWRSMQGRRGRHSMRGRHSSAPWPSPNGNLEAAMWLL